MTSLQERRCPSCSAFVPLAANGAFLGHTGRHWNEDCVMSGCTAAGCYTYEEWLLASRREDGKCGTCVACGKVVFLDMINHIIRHGKKDGDPYSCLGSYLPSCEIAGVEPGSVGAELYLDSQLQRRGEPTKKDKETVAEWANRAREQLDRLGRLRISVSACADFLKLDDRERATLDHEMRKANEERFGSRDGRTIKVVIYNAIDSTAEVRDIYHMETDMVGMNVVAVVGGVMCRHRDCVWCSDLDTRIQSRTLNKR